MRTKSMLVAACFLAGAFTGPNCCAHSQEADSASETDKSKPTSEAIDLLEGEFSKNWKIFDSGSEGVASEVWKVIQEEPDGESVLVCSGEPKGFVYTHEKYDDFELTLDWKFPKDANGNSGVLVYVQDEPRIWPTSIQVQLHQPKAGSIFPSGDATSDNTRELESDLAKPVNTWNQCRIVSRDGRLGVEINGKKAGEISGAMPFSGSIALQCEGSEVHFRRLRLKKLDSESSDSTPIQDLIPANAKPDEPAAASFCPDARRHNRTIRHRRHYDCVASASEKHQSPR